MTSGLRILWVDDQVQVAETMSMTLKALDTAITFAGDGEEALVVAATERFDLVITDLQMPPGEWGGLWLLRELQAMVGHVPPILVLSGEGAQQQTIQSLRLGAADYVRKDDAHLDLLDRVQALCSHPLSRAEELLHLGESESVEFKSTARWNLHSKKRDKQMEHAVLKTVAGFANASGGTLVIGADDHGVPLGLEDDFKTLGRKDIDGFENWLFTLLEKELGATEASRLAVSFESVRGLDVCLVDVPAAPAPVFVSGDNGSILYVRRGNATTPFDTREAVRYVAEHWP